MSSLENRFIELLVESGVLLSGHFKLKSGRYSPYFVDFGVIRDGRTLKELGSCYASKIMRDVGSENFDVVFGPAYKGIPIAVATSIALHEEFGIVKGYAFNRKVLKDHGERSLFLGAKLTEGIRVLIIDDVITDGGTKYETIDLLRANTPVRIIGSLVGVDRSESPDVAKAFTETAHMPLWSIVSIDQVRQFMNRTGAATPLES